MRDIYIPQILYSGSQTRFLRGTGVMCGILAIILYLLLIVFFQTLYDNGLLTLFLTPEFEFLDEERTMQYVLVDEGLEDEELEDETITNRGKVSQISRDLETNPELAKLGPRAEEERNMIEFSEGETLSVPSVSIEGVQQPPQPPTPAPQPPAMQQISAIPPLPEPVEILEPEPSDMPESEQITEKPLEDTNKIEQHSELATFDMPTPEDLESILTVQEKENVDLAPQALAQIKPEQTSQAFEQLQPVPEQQKTQKPAQQINPSALPELPPLPEPSNIPLNIPIQRIAAPSQKEGGNVGRVTESSATLNASFRQMAVLRDRYGEYMDKILRRIQSAIFTQQQLSPFRFMRGNVIMTFTINPRGKLDRITYIQSIPDSLPAESAACRQVLDSVAAGAPFDPPTAQMLNDPDFQRITINFVFEPK